MSTKRLTRSQDRMLGGVCAGLATYFEIDPTLVRLGFVALLLLGIGSPVLIYLLLWVVIPQVNEDPKPFSETLDEGIAEITHKASELGGELKARVEEITRPSQSTNGKTAKEDGIKAESTAEATNESASKVASEVN